MFRFAGGCFTIFSAVFVVNVAGNHWYRTYDVVDFLQTALSLCIIPSLSAVAVSHMIHRQYPRRLFDANAGHPIRPVLCGFAAALLALIIATPCVVLLDRFLNDAVILGAASPLSTGFIMRFCAKKKPGLCTHCGYDLRGSLDIGRCPECGLALSQIMRTA